MKIMAIDYGDARTGIAISDLTNSIVGSSMVIHQKNIDLLIDKIVETILENNISDIVIGLPKNMNASLGERANKSIAFKELLETKINITPIMWDERSTTVSAINILSQTGVYGKKRKNKVDAVAASIILQNYLDFKNFNK